MKPQRAIKRRNRREGQIAREAQTNMNAAVELARYGRYLTPLEREVWTYLSQMESAKRFGLKKPFSPQAAGRLFRWFLDAVDRRDGNALREMARAVDNFQPDSPPEDSLRADILILKSHLDSRGQKMTFREFCIAINRRVGIPAIDKAIQEVRISDCSPCFKIPDSTLRCLAKELKFPLVKEKTGRPKNSAK
jgi:hypothetical protein